jgi:serine/threonine protein kinase
LLQDRYRLMRELGRGGMGIVYLGRDERLDRSVAVKVILSDGSGSSGSASLDTRMRSSFAEEARLWASLTHPAIATVFDFGFQHENPFTIFEFIEGETLRELIERRGRLPLDEVRLIIGPIAQALDFAHARRIVHRDLKPENIRATEQRLFKILDLGLAREFSRQDDWRFAGTPAYAAPEQAAERPPDGRTDQYALAVIIFEMLTGSRPFQSESWLDLLEKHYSEPPPSPRTLVPELSEIVEAAVLKSLEKDPNLRFSTCTELAVALGCQFLTGPVALPEMLLETEIKKMGGRWKSRVYPFSFKRPITHLALTPEALWAIHRTELVRWPTSALHGLRRRGLRGLSFQIRGVAGKQSQWLRFKSRKERRAWHESLEAAIAGDANGEKNAKAGASDAIVQEPAIEPSAAAIEPRVEPVVLLKGRPATRFQLLGMVEAKAPRRRRAENGLKIRAAMMEADAVIDLNTERLPGFVRTEHRASGMAVRAVDDEGRVELKSRWFSAQIARIQIPMLIMAILFGGIGRYADSNLSPDGSPREPVAVVATPPISYVGECFWVAIASLTLGMSVLRWPQLVRPTAICFLAKAAELGLSVISGFAGAAVESASILGMPTAPDAALAQDPKLASVVVIASMLLNAAWSISFLLFYLHLGRTSWRIDSEFRNLAATSLQSTPAPRMRRMIGAIAWFLAVSASVVVVGFQAKTLAEKVIDVGAAIRGGPANLSREARSKFARQMNDSAWQLATDSDAGRRKKAIALGNVENALRVEPENPHFLRTRGVVRYKTDDYSGAIGDLKRSVELGGPDAVSSFFMAMAYAQLGELDRAKNLYADADRWMGDHGSDDPELRRFREQAAALLYMKSLEVPKTQPERKQPSSDSKSGAGTAGK